MPTVELRKEVKKKVTENRVVKSALHAHKCQACDRVFGMNKWRNDQLKPGQLHGTFNKSANDRNGRGLGNMFFATVCSFECAGRIVNEELWKTWKNYKPYAKAGATLARVELGLTQIINEEALINEWEAKEESSNGFLLASGFTSDPVDNRGNETFVHLSLVEAFETLDEVIGITKKLSPKKNEAVEKARRKLPSWCANAIESVKS